LLGLFGGLGVATAVWGIFFRHSPRPTFANIQFNRWALVTALLWLLLGIAPVLATGAELSTTRAIGILARPLPLSRPVSRYASAGWGLKRRWQSDQLRLDGAVRHSAHFQL
jgi:hypothetical protein